MEALRVVYEESEAYNLHSGKATGNRVGGKALNLHPQDP